jgi:hypothetical protein
VAATWWTCRSAVHRDLLQQRDSIGEAMVHEFVTLAVRTLSVGAVDDVLSGDGGGGGAAGGDGDGEALAVMLETTLKPLVEGLARVRQLENALDGFQKRLVARGESNEIKTFLATVRCLLREDGVPLASPELVAHTLIPLPPTLTLTLKLLHRRTSRSPCGRSCRRMSSPTRACPTQSAA